MEAEKNIPAEQNEVLSGDSSVADDDFGVPKGYWTSYRFLGSMSAILLLANNDFIAYAMPVSINNRNSPYKAT
jgi:hypothetical protein